MLSAGPLFQPSQPTLETERLSIRIDTEQAYVRAFHTYSDAELKAHFGILTDQALKTQKEKVRGGLSTYRTSVVFFHLIERTLDKVIGSFAFHNWYPAHRRSEIGYAMSEDAWKAQGYMREAARPIVEFGFREMALNRMEAVISPQNVPSIKLVERLGFQQEGHLREHYIVDDVAGDSMMYALLERDYRVPSA